MSFRFAEQRKFPPLDENFANFNNVSYAGDSLSIYDPRLHVTNISNETIIVNLTQYNPIENQQIIPATYSEMRGIPILSYKSNAYGVCVHSVDLPSNSIYLMEWEDKVNATIPYDKYTITVSYFDGAVQQPPQVIPLQFSPYYNNDLAPGNVKRVFALSQLVESLNQAYATAFSNLGIIPGTAPGSICNPPVFVEDKANQTLILYCDERMNPAAGNPNYTTPNPQDWVNTPGIITIKLGYNFWVGQWFASSFPVVIIDNNIDNNQNTLLKVYNNGDPNLFTTIGGIKYYQIYQTSTTIDLISTVEKVVIVTNINTRPQYSSFRSLSSINNIISSSSNSLSILFDFDISLSSAGDNDISRPISFSPKTKMYQDIVDESPLNYLYFKMFVMRSTGVLTEVFLNPGQAASIKLLFALK